MEKNTEYVAQITISEQYTEDSWKAVRPTLKVTDTTTIGEIRQWMKTKQAERVDEFTVIRID